MGLIRGSVTLANPTRPELVPLPVSALADSGASPFSLALSSACTASVS
jgi:hypothetical protein